MSTKSAAAEADAARSAANLSIGYVVAMAGEMLHAFPIDLLDLLLVFTVASANAAPPQDPPPRKGAAAQRTGISRNAVSRALNLPLETVRRRIGNLIAKKVFIEQADGLVFAQDNPLGLGSNAQLATVNLEHLRQLFRGLKAIGLKLE